MVGLVLFLGRWRGWWIVGSRSVASRVLKVVASFFVSLFGLFVSSLASFVMPLLFLLLFACILAHSLASSFSLSVSITTFHIQKSFLYVAEDASLPFPASLFHHASFSERSRLFDSIVLRVRGTVLGHDSSVSNGERGRARCDSNGFRRDVAVSPRPSPAPSSRS